MSFRRKAPNGVSNQIYDKTYVLYAGVPGGGSFRGYEVTHVLDR